MLDHRLKLFVFVGTLLVVASSFSCNTTNSDDETVIYRTVYCMKFPESGCFVDPAPLPGDPRYGLAGQVFIEDSCKSWYSEDEQLDCLWIGVDDPTIMDQIQANKFTAGMKVIAGKIKADPTQIHGFYLDPSTISYLKGDYFDIVTSIDQVESDPAYYEPGGAGGKPEWGLPLDIRAIVLNP